MWVAIPDFPKYEISDSGEVRSLLRPTPVVLKRRYLRGYVRYALCRDGKPFHLSAHRLMWTVFVGPIKDGLEINHINGVKDDNRLSNLEPVTHEQNVRHRKDVLRFRGVRGSRNNLAKLNEDSVAHIIRLAKAGLETARIAEQFNVSASNVSYILSGKTWKDVPR